MTRTDTTRRTLRTTAATVCATLLLAGALTGCTEVVSGTPGPRPTVVGAGSASADPTDSPTDSSSDDPTDSPTDDPTDDPTDSPTDDPSDTTDDDGSPQALCADLQSAIDNTDGIDPDLVSTLVSLAIFSWGIAANEDDPYAQADAVTTAACPDVRTAVLSKTGKPDLASTEN